VLSRNSSARVRVYAVWEPILITDLARPISAVLHRMADPRVRQYWDRGHLLSDRMNKDARPPQPAPECCERRGYLFDVAAVYQPGATWTDRLPTATVFNGAVIDIADQLGAALKQ
jgi:hypothetical protein